MGRTKNVAKSTPVVAVSKNVAKSTPVVAVSKTASNSKNTINPLYRVSEMTNRTRKNNWVTFVEGHPNAGYVFSGTLTRDQVRNATRKIVGATRIDSIRSQRVENFRKNNA
jgi:hypothetical protein